MGYGLLTIDAVDPIPDNDHITDNIVLGNGATLDPRVAPSPQPTCSGTAYWRGEIVSAATE